MSILNQNRHSYQSINYFTLNFPLTALVHSVMVRRNGSTKAMSSLNSEAASLFFVNFTVLLQVAYAITEGVKSPVRLGADFLGSQDRSVNGD